MDEEFHVAQFQKTQNYLFAQNGLWEWDPKITTFPGLYFLTSALVGSCKVNLTILRGINAFLMNGLLYYTVGKLTEDNWAIASAVVLYPLNFFYSLLYYTDSVATVFVIITAMFMKKKEFFISGFFGLLSVFMRQTNIVWLFGLCLLEVISRLPVRWSMITSVLRDMWLHALVGLGFVYFVFAVNDSSIVLGHKEYHSFSLHFAQINYLVLTAVGACGPSEWLFIIKGFFSTEKKPRLIPLVSCFLMSLGAAYFGTVAHPFILSDNRHYSFYFFKYFISRPWIRYLLIPLTVSVSLVYSRILRPITSQLIWLCALISLFPTPLIEFRYFNITISLLLGSQKFVHRNTIIFFLIVNIVTVFMFVFRPFIGVDGKVARFMY